MTSHLFFNPVAAFLTCGLLAFGLSSLIVATAGLHGRFTMDAPGAVQKFHSEPTPRVGGIAIFLALLAACAMLPEGDARSILTTILFAGLPAGLIGLLEDVTKRVRVLVRLVATFASAAVACWFTGIVVTRLDVPLMDALLVQAPVGLIFTIFAVGGVSNSINIIDGFHGLASGTVIICLLAMAAIASAAGDGGLALAALIVAASVLGFWLVNFPWGRLFLGDGGAYFAGLALGWFAVLLPMRNADVSPWASLLVCAYPITEVIYSIARRWRTRQSAGSADRRHFHSLVSVRVVQKRFADFDPNLQNAAVSLFMWMIALVPAVVAFTFHGRTVPLIVSAFLFLGAYHMCYMNLSRE
ncbi:MAG TPA: glycosyltransferase [Ramlibacter sp.]|nr:glycosyltransferase [Ramlibacter sp.]